MKLFGLNILGKIKVQRVLTLPSFGGEADKGKIIYDQTTKLMYYGASGGWTPWGSSGSS
jgi:hypothetical protein